MSLGTQLSSLSTESIKTLDNLDMILSAPGHSQYLQCFQERAVVLLFMMGGDMSVAGCSAAA